jgi:hypothetical protein
VVVVVVGCVPRRLATVFLPACNSMYLLDSQLLRSLKLENDHLEIQKFGKINKIDLKITI